MSTANEWAWVNAEPAAERALLWKIRRACIIAGIPNGQQIIHAENIALTRMSVSRRLNEMSYGELWRLIDFLEHP